MEQFVESIRLCVSTRNWFGGLYLSLAMPDICGSLENPNARVGDRYRKWFDQHLASKWVAPAVGAQGPMTAALPPQLRALIAKAPQMVSLTADNCYRLRCRCLHEGIADRGLGVDDQIHFTEPGGARQNYVSDHLQVSADAFCSEMADAVEAWWAAAKGDPDVAQRAQKLIRIYPNIIPRPSSGAAAH